MPTFRSLLRQGQPRSWLVRFVEHRIGDRRIIRLIQKWLKAGVLEGGPPDRDDGGYAAGSAASARCLANVYLHYVYDLWVQQWRQRCATGDVIVVRYADDTIVGFQHRHDAERFLADLKASARHASRSPLHPDKTGSSSSADPQLPNAGMHGVIGKPETFDFLGFTHFCATRRSGLASCSGADRRPSECGQAPRDQGAANGHTARRRPKGRAAGSARFCAAGLAYYRCADERLSDLSIPASHDRTLARRSDASKPKTSTNVDENEEDR